MNLTPTAARQAFALRVGRMTDEELRAELSAARADRETISLRVSNLNRRAPLSDRHRAAIAALRSVSVTLDVLSLAADRRGLRA